jgi:hypothetical protein
MNARARRAVVRFAGLVLLASAAAGCTVPSHFERGARLSSEQRNVASTTEYKVDGVTHLERVPPELVVWLDQRVTSTGETRDLYQKVAVSGRRRLSFEPTFLLWPYNLVRVPVGLLGCVFTGVDLGLHYAAGGVGAVVGVTTAILAYAAVSAGSLFSLFQLSDVTGFGLAADITTLFVFILETPLVPLDAPLKFAFGTSFWPVAYNRKSFPSAWVEGIAKSWHYAWDFRAYPPFIVWTHSDEVRNDVPGETMPGPWTPATTTGEWTPAPAESFTVEARGRTQVVQAIGGVAAIDLRALSAGMGPSEVLDLKVTVQAPTGAVSEDFSFRAAQLLAGS